MNNPFDLANYKAQISMVDVERARKSAYQQTRVVNESRKKGIEPSKPYSERDDLAFGMPHKLLIVELPQMKIHKSTVNKRKTKAKLRQHDPNGK